MTVLSGQRLTAALFSDNTRHTIPGGYTAITSNFPSSGTVTAETVYLTSGTLTLRNGRAFGVSVSTLIMGTSPDTARIFVKRTGTSGSVLFDTQGAAFPRSGSNGRLSYENVATNQTGADITGVLVATIQRLSGTAAGVAIPASAASPSYILIEDIGAATDYPSATAIS